MVVMKPSEHKSIIYFLDSCLSEHDEFICLDMLKKKFPDCSEDTLGSILHQHVNKRTITNTKSIAKNIDRIKEIYMEYVKEDRRDFFLELSKQYKLSPVSAARQFLNAIEKKSDTLSVSQQINDTTLIKDPYMSYEVYLATLCDSSYSMISAVIKMYIGKEYEIILQNYVKKEGILFKSEHDLRKLGYKKTPDILLEIPVAVEKSIVTWIESKALFADEYCHYDYMQTQYSHYSKAYGPGLVIYWLGHTSSIQCTEGVLVCDKFPDKIVQLQA